MQYQDIIVEKKGPVAWLTLNKPHVMNAMGWRTFEDIIAALDDFEKDPAIVVVVIKGANDTFCAGVDLKEHAQRVATGDLSLKAAFSALADKAFNGLENFPKVTIAMVKGVCMAGGIEIAEVCDFIFADEKCRIGDGHMRTGIVPNAGASIRMPRNIGMRKAKELLYTGDLISGREAEKIGLINKAVPADKLEETVAELVAKLVDKPPLALQAMKMLVNRGLGCTVEAGLMLERNTVNYLQSTEDFNEAMAAFIEKRKAVYHGR
jgi:enoyl-CoA hydratase/carnithine racemase